MINKIKTIASPLNAKHGYIVEIEEQKNELFEARIRHIEFLEDGFKHLKYFSQIQKANKEGLIKYLTTTANEHIDNYDKELFFEQYLIKSQFEDVAVDEE